MTGFYKNKRGIAGLLNIVSIGLAFMMISWSLLAFSQGHFYGTIGVALNWFVLGFGITILLTRFGCAKVLRPPVVYFYVGFFLVMFINTMGWV